MVTTNTLENAIATPASMGLSSPDAATGMSVWWRDHADHHMAVLMDPDGPFATATEGEENTSKRGEPLPYVAPPEGMFPDVREETDEPPVDDAH